jgi:hypothetical protein
MQQVSMARETILISSEESDHRTTSDDASDGTSDGTSHGSDGYSGDDDTSSDYDTDDSSDGDGDHDPIMAERGKVLCGWSDIN